MGITISSSLSLKKIKKLINQNNDVITSLSSFNAGVKQGLSPTVVPMAQIPSGDFSAVRVHVPSGKSMKVWAAGVQNNNNVVPTSCSAQVVDESGGGSHSYPYKRTEGSPLASIDGPTDVRLASNNGSGSTQNLTSFFTITIE